MVLKRNVGLKGFKYRGGGPMWSFILHRIGGLAMIIFVGTHIWASFATQQFGSDLGISLNIIYESVYFQLVLYFFVIFHALNGGRIILLDTWPQFLEFQREITWAQWIIFVVIYSLTAFVMINTFLAA